MTSQATSIAKRLCEAGSPDRLKDWEKKDGYYVATCRVSQDDVPNLINIARKWSDPEWPGDDLGLEADSDDVDLLPVTAWRTLADLKSGESVEPLIYMLCELDEDDDWASAELPQVFGKIGKPAIAALVRLANDADKKQEFVRAIAAEALHRVAEYHPETRDEVVACLAEMMTKAAESDVVFNSTVLVGLVDLRAAEAAEAIERAFASNRLDVGMIGDWEYVRQKLGVAGLGLEMPKHPHNSIEQLRRRMGIGIFSDQRIFDHDGCVSDAEQAYYEQAWDVFSKSKEAKQVVDRLNDLGWFRMFLEFGINYRGETVDEMTLASVEDFVFEYVPRKVSTEPEQAASIVLELTKFWEYLDRVFELPAATSIVQWLKTDGLAARLEAELSDPANFGMAKSMFMSGKAAGYDMTSERGMAEFIAAYNQSLRRSEKAPPPGKIASKHQRVGPTIPVRVEAEQSTRSVAVNRSSIIAPWLSFLPILGSRKSTLFTSSFRRSGRKLWSCHDMFLPLYLPAKCDLARIYQRQSDHEVGDAERRVVDVGSRYPDMALRFQLKRGAKTQFMGRGVRQGYGGVLLATNVKRNEFGYFIRCVGDSLPVSSPAIRGALRQLFCVICVR